jgi:hypothetical protein
MASNYKQASAWCVVGWELLLLEVWCLSCCAPGRHEGVPGIRMHGG